MTKTEAAIILAAALALTTNTAPVNARQQQSGAPAQRAQKSDAAQGCPQAPQPSDGKHGEHHGQDHSARGGAKSYAEHLAAVNERGERAMGFSQTRTTHRFFLKKDGGVIQVEADDANDAESRERVRQHLAGVARLFAAGDFRTPLAVHERFPPGALEMCRLRASIRYEFEQTERGGRVLIKTNDKAALAAIHAFLRFQISDHQTGDKPEVTN